MPQLLQRAHCPKKKEADFTFGRLQRGLKRAEGGLKGFEGGLKPSALKGGFKGLKGA